MEIVVDLGLLIGLTVGITEVFKRLFGMNDEIGKRYLPAVSLLVGCILSTLHSGPGFMSVVMGILIGLSSSGLFSSTKAIAGK